MIQELIFLGDNKLKKKSLPVDDFSSSLVTLVDDMIETMYAQRGIGLAAVQIGILKRIFVIDIAEETDGPIVFINPTITYRSKELMSYEEGCLSIPSVLHTINRPKKVTVDYFNAEGEKQQFTAEGLLAVCIQHEYDHLEGVLFIDHATSKKEQQEINQKLLDSNLKEYFH